MFKFFKKEQKTNTVYHLFWHGSDEWFEDLEECVSVVDDLIEDGQADIRIHKEVRAVAKDIDEDGELISEDCLFSMGGFPM